jgi:1,2-diacylglycerol 3-alpha-glucosyltransferase
MKKKLRIYFYTDTFLPAVDGVVTSMLGFKKELERRGHEVYIVTPGDSETKKLAMMHDHIILVPGLKFRRYPQYRFALMPFIAAMKNDLNNADIIHLQTPFFMGIYGLLLSKMSRIPAVGSFHTLFTSSNVIREYASASRLANNVLVRYAWPYARFFYNKCTSVIAPSASIDGLLKRQQIHNVSIVPNGIDTERFNPKVSGRRVRARLLGRSRDKLVLYVGRLSTEKNVETLIRAAHILRGKPIRFAIVGTGPAMKKYVRMAARYELDSKVRFIGFVPDKELPQYYAAADLFCMPSTFETQGIVALEAMACGKPVVGADYMALKELIRNGRNGEKFMPRNSRDCARKIEKVINNMSSYKMMVSTADQYSVKKTTDRLLDVYERAIEKGVVKNSNSYYSSLVGRLSDR